jgi:hypothetical protein
MKKAERYDNGSIGKVKIQPNGFLHAPAYLTRTGVFKYRLRDGSIRRELRTPDEVFNSDSLDTLRMTALTMGHPSKPVTTDNARGLSIGAVGQDVRVEDNKIAATIVVTDGESISTMKRGRRQISCGYWCDLDFTPGVTEDGEEYDAIQRNIIYNHAAVVDRGRAGPEISARLDADDDSDFAVMVTDDEDELTSTVNSDSAVSSQVEVEKSVDHNAAESVNPQRDETMKFTKKFDGIDYDYEAATESGKQALDKAIDALTARADAADEGRDAAEKATDAEKARADAAEEKVAELEKARADADAVAPEKIREAVRARVALETAGAKVLGEDFNADAADDEIKRAVVLKVSPGAAEKLDGASDDYLKARFDAAVEDFDKNAKAKADAQGANGEVRKAAAKADGTGESIVEKARREMHERNAKKASEPLSASKDRRDDFVSVAG